MFFKVSGRENPRTKKYDSYYRLVESYRNETGRVCHRTILNVGFINDELSPEQMNQIARILTDMSQGRQNIFPETDILIQNWVTELWGRIRKENRIDLAVYEPSSRMINADTIKHSNVREMGAEWLSYNAWQKLGIDKILEEHEFSEQEIKLAQTQVISRAVYPASELATSRWINENSAVMELTGYDSTKMNKDRLYKSALKLNNIKEELEKYLSVKTNELFDITDTVMLYDLTNTYFEGEKRNSKLAKYGRSKEKRRDCKLVVLAVVTNRYGFLKHSAIHEGNFSDTKDLEKILNNLDDVVGRAKPIIVMDAGIATESNLKLVKEKGYEYLCVSRTKFKNYEIDANRLTVILETKSKKEVILKKIQNEVNDEYVLEVCSDSKAMKESGMKTQYESRFEEELNKIKASIHKKGGVKQVDKVNQRVGRAKQKYPSAQKNYEITITSDEKKIKAVELTWAKNANKEKRETEELGKYFLRSSMDLREEVRVWNVYNTIREIENTFRILKTDLDLRPIYHKKDESTIAHLNLGLLAYWLVNTIRYQLKREGINYNWKEIVRIGNTQKVITTSGYNKAGEEITVRKCSEPSEKLKLIQAALKVKPRPFVKSKSVVHKPEIKKIQSQHIQILLLT